MRAYKTAGNLGWDASTSHLLVFMWHISPNNGALLVIYCHSTYPEWYFMIISVAAVVVVVVVHVLVIIPLDDPQRDLGSVSLCLYWSLLFFSSTSHTPQSSPQLYQPCSTLWSKHTGILRSRNAITTCSMIGYVSGGSRAYITEGWRE